ncbi:MAG: trypsin-like peptidase domain-containing protein [Myxococcales bacterium]|nr:trypsin-like peptidase domain-containing protein [Myxococcales bacterium]
MRPACLLSVLALSLPPSGAAQGAQVEEWVRARAREQEAPLRAEAREQPKSEQLWRERPANDPGPPDFVPPTTLAPLIRAVRPGVVNIGTSNARGSSGGPSRSAGSGFIISPDGHVVTNNHVVDRARQIRVKLADGREFLAEVVGRDPSTDLALLKLQGEVGQLPCTYLGDSDNLEVGDWVVAIGNPFGLDHSVSHGMISAKERVIGVGIFDDFIQTDALINPGNSGGPLFNMRGEVVGVNTAIISQGQGIGFAVPINMVKELLPNLLVNGRLARGWLGVNIQQQGGAGAQKGAVVMDVFKGSPAASAGIRPGDRVTAVNGRAIESYLQLLRRIAILAPGTEVKLTVHRESKGREVAVKLTERPSPQSLQALAAAGRLDELGVVVRDLTPEIAQNLGSGPTSGVLVAGVLPQGPAEQAGLQAGDLITEVNKRRVQDVKGLRAALEASGQSQTALVRFQRGDAVRYVVIRLAG